MNETFESHVFNDHSVSKKKPWNFDGIFHIPYFCFGTFLKLNADFVIFLIIGFSFNLVRSNVSLNVEDISIK